MRECSLPIAIKEFFGMTGHEAVQEFKKLNDSDKVYFKGEFEKTKEYRIVEKAAV